MRNNGIAEEVEKVERFVLENMYFYIYVFFEYVESVFGWGVLTK